MPTCGELLLPGSRSSKSASRCRAATSWILQRTIIAADGPHSKLGEAVGWDWKGKLSPLFYIVAIASTFGVKWVAQAIYVAVALIWLVPDRRIEHRLEHER